MDILIDPLTRDYVLQGGVLSHDPAGGLANSCFMRLEIPLGSYWADRALGSRLHELQREKDLARVGILAKQYAEMALAPVLADGRASKITVTTQRAASRLSLLIEVLAANGQTLTFQHLVGVI